MAKSKETSTYKYTNTHPKNLKHQEDCVIRSISIATNKDWLTVYDELCNIGRQVFDAPTSRSAYQIYLESIGKREPAIVNGKRITAKQIAQRQDNKTYVISQAGHLTCVKNNKVKDTWDCGDRASYVIWRIK